VPDDSTKAIQLPSVLTVKELSDRLNAGHSSVIRALLKEGIIASSYQTIDYDTAARIARGLGFEVTRSPGYDEPNQ